MESVGKGQQWREPREVKCQLGRVGLTLLSDSNSALASSSCASRAFLALVMTPILLSASVACWRSSAFSDCALAWAACRVAMVLSYSLSCRRNMVT